MFEKKESEQMLVQKAWNHAIELKIDIHSKSYPQESFVNICSNSCIVIL